MSSRKEILDAIKKNKPELSPLPELNTFSNEKIDNLAYLREVMKIIGGVLEEIPDMESLPNAVSKAYKGKTNICSNIPGFALTSVDMSVVNDPHDLKDVDLVVLKGQLVVAENGAVWLSERDLIHRAAGFITQHMALVVNRNSMVWNMHEAYQKIKLDRPGYGVFVSGPSKTADIEQSLVIGAHGARSMTLYLVG
jgi:L-lactate dehydrogenase complex protein LldG